MLFSKRRYNTGIDDLFNEYFFMDVFTNGTKFYCVNSGFSGSDTLVSFNINGTRQIEATYPSEITPEDYSGVLNLVRKSMNNYMNWFEATIF